MTHKPESCFLNRKSGDFKGEDFLKKYEEKENRKVEQD